MVGAYCASCAITRRLKEKPKKKVMPFSKQWRKTVKKKRKIYILLENGAVGAGAFLFEKQKNHKMCLLQHDHNNQWILFFTHWRYGYVP